MKDKTRIIVIGLLITLILGYLAYSAYDIIEDTFGGRITEEDIKEARETLHNIESFTLYNTDDYDLEQFKTYTAKGSDGKKHKYRHKIESFTLDAAATKNLFPKAAFKPVYKSWKDNKVGTVKLSTGKTIKIIISTKGGCFSLENIPGHYAFEGTAMTEWYKAIDFSKFGKNEPEVVK